MAIVIPLWSFLSPSAVLADVFHMPEGRRSLETVLVGHPGNAPDDSGLGAVGYAFRIAKYEVTTAQYVEFLNAKAMSDADGGLWNNDMDSTRSGEGIRCEIRRAGDKGKYTHHIPPELLNRPVTHVSFLDACRFCNWLQNGQGNGDTETGAYTLAGYSGRDGRRIRRNPGAKWFIPSEDEWYKAAYFDPRKPGGAGYWDYPTRSNEKPNRDITSAYGANYYLGTYLDPKRFFTDVGAFSQAAGPFGTFDQAGNAIEWTEGLIPPFLRCVWGGAFDMDDGGRNVRAPNVFYTSISDVPNIGFRVAAAVEGIEAQSTIGQTAPSPLTPAITEFPRRPWRDPETGKPFFPLAWFSYESDHNDLDDIAREGGNLVLYVNSPSDVDSDQQLQDNIARMKRYLDHARSRKLKVLVQLAGWYGAHMRGNVAEIERQRQWTLAIRDHPALFGYQLYDEPEYKTGGGLGVEAQTQVRQFVEGLRLNRDTIRRWDPNPHRMVSVVFNLVPLSSWTEFLPVIDSFQVDRYPLDKEQAYFGHRGDWGPLMMAWSMNHGAEALKEHRHLLNPAPCMQGVGWLHTESGVLGLWRDPLYEETRYMAYSSMTVGGWGIFHWIRKFGRPDSPAILRQVARLHTELRSLFPALEQSYENPPFTARHNHEGITRGFLTDSVADITSLSLEDRDHYYLIVSNNSGTFTDISIRMKLAQMKGKKARQASVLNEEWDRRISFSEDTGDWVLDTHTMCFGDVNIWLIPKAEPLE